MIAVNFNTTIEEDTTIAKITKRAKSLNPRINSMDVMMDLTAVHCNGCKLKLSELLNANNSDFIHDVAGITQNINRDTGGLTNCFLPRFHTK